MERTDMTDLAQRHSHTVSPDSVRLAGDVRDQAVPGLIRPIVQHQADRSKRVSLPLFRILVPLAIVGLWWLLTGTGVIDPHGPVLACDYVEQLRGPVGPQGTCSGTSEYRWPRAGIGLAIGGGIGLILGIIVGLFSLGEELLDSSLQMFRVIPFPAVIFLFIVWFGIGETAKVALDRSGHAVPHVPEYFQWCSQRGSTGGRSRSFLRPPRVATDPTGGHPPVSSVQILTGLRFSAGISIVALVFAETINANKGIGYLANQAASFNQVSVLVVCIIIYALMGIVADVIVRLIERAAMPWRRQMAVR